MHTNLSLYHQLVHHIKSTSQLITKQKADSRTHVITTSIKTLTERKPYKS